MADIRAQDLPDIRIALLTSERDRVEQRAWANDTKPHEPCWEAGGFDRTMIEEVKQQALEEGDLFYVAPPMCELADTAARTVPDFDVVAEDLPSLSGLMVFGSSPPSFIDRHEPGSNCTCSGEHHVVWSGALWRESVNKAGSPAIIVYPVIDQHRAALARGQEPPSRIPRYYTHGAIVIPHGHDHGGSPIGPLLRTVRTACMLMQQPLADMSTVDLDRATRKRLRRAGQEARPIRVIGLRRSRTVDGAGDSEGSYHHQWIVRGHWRNHWHPKRQVHRPIWIAPHVKGPEGAPMLGGEKVYALKR